MKIKKVIAVVALVACNLKATTYYVDVSRPDDSGDGASWRTAKKTIQAAVDRAANYDTVLVTNGVYNSGAKKAPNFALNNRVVINKAITVRSVNGAANTFIEGSGTASFGTTSAIRCVFIAQSATLDGFTLRQGATFSLSQTNAFSETTGGGIYGAGCQIRNCIVKNCMAALGGGIAGGTVYNCTITQNRVTNGGGGTEASDIYNSIIYDNDAGFAAGSYYGTRVNCTIVGNRASWSYNDGAGVSFGNTYNSIVWNNTVNGVVNNYYLANGGVLSYCCTYPLPSGTGNLSSDPLFVDASSADYRLLKGSPCLNVGNNSYAVGSIDLLGSARIQNSTVDMGAFEGGNALPQSITIPSLSAKTYGDADFTLGATASSGLDVEYASGTPAVIAVTNGLFHIIGAGKATVFVSQPGNEAYAAAPTITNTFTVAQAPLSVRVLNTNCVYGAAIPRFSVVYDGFVNGETADVLAPRPTLSSSAHPSSPVGDYPITATGAVATNYSLTCYPGLLTVTPKPLTICASDQQKAYGQTLNLGTNKFTAADLETNDAVSCVTLSSTGTAADAPTGSYAITPSDAQGAGLSNYLIAYKTGTLTVCSPLVVITPNDGTVFTNSLLVSFSCALSNATVRFTLDGTDPAETSAAYTSAIPLTASATVRARAFVEGAEAGPVSNAVFKAIYGISATHGTLNGATTGFYATGTNLSLVADAAPIGRHFNRWSITPSNADLGPLFDAFQPATSVTVPPYAVAISASWSANTYIVTFDPQGGAVELAKKIVAFDSVYGALPTPVRKGYRFAGWWTGIGGTGTQVTESSAMEQTSDFSVYAAWSEDPLLCPTGNTTAFSATGSYDGFFYSTDDFSDTAASSVNGTLSLNVTTLAGKLTAKAVLQTGTLSFSSKKWESTDTNGTSHVTIGTLSGEKLDLYVSQNRIWGSLTGGKVGPKPLSLDGARNRFKDSKDTEAQTLLNGYRGYYTMSLLMTDSIALGTADTAPKGSGYLTLTVGNEGSATIAGMMADGTRVSQASRLILFEGCGPEACVPFFTPLYAGKGWTGGLLWIDFSAHTVVTDRYLGWFIRWEKPASVLDGFSALLDVCGGLYDTPPTLALQYLFTAETNSIPYHYRGGVAALQTAALPNSIIVTTSNNQMSMARWTLPALANSAYDYSEANTAMTTLFFNARTGIFWGNFNLYYDYVADGRLQHKTVVVPYSGVLTPIRSADFANEPTGQGYYLVPDSDPAVKSHNLRLSYQVWLDAVP